MSQDCADPYSMQTDGYEMRPPFDGTYDYESEFAFKLNQFVIWPKELSCQEQIHYECITWWFPEGGEGCDLCFIGDFHGNDCLGLRIPKVSQRICPPGIYEV